MYQANNKEEFLKVIDTIVTDPIQKDELAKAYDSLESISTYFKENFKLQPEEVDALAERYTQNYMNNLNDEESKALEKEFDEDPFKVLVSIYQKFLYSKEFKNDIQTELKLILTTVAALANEKR